MGGGCPQPARAGGVHAASVQCARTELPPAAARTLSLSGAPTPESAAEARQQMRTEPRRNLPQAGDRGAAASQASGPPYWTRRSAFDQAAQARCITSNRPKSNVFPGLRRP